MDSSRSRMLQGLTPLFGPQSEVDLKENLRDMDEAGVAKSVIVAIDAETVSGFKISNDLIAGVVRKHPDRFVGFASVDPHKGKLAIEEMERAVRSLGLRGLKLIPNLIETFPNDKSMYRVYEKALQLKIPVLIHTGTLFHQGSRMKYSQPIFLDDVAIDFPELKIIMAHFGFPWFSEALAIVQRHLNVYFNIAGWAPKHIPEMVVKYMDSILSDKVLFGSDYPLISRKRIINELSSIGLKKVTLDKLLSENAVKLLE